MKIFKLSSVVFLLLILSACGEDITGTQAQSHQQNNPGTPAALAQFAEEMFQQDENSPPMNIDQMNLDVGEEMPNTIFDHMLPDVNQ